MSITSIASSIRSPFQLLEITLISAQDLSPASKSMQTYAVSWVQPHRRLTTRVDQHGHTHPSWNDKFVFRVDDTFLSSPTSALTVEIFAVSWFRDIKLGSVRLLISTLLPPSAPTPTSDLASANMRFVALQIRRPSGRPQGILNLGVALLDSAMRSMPLYTDLSASAVGYRDLINQPMRRTQSDKNLPSSLCISGSINGSEAGNIIAGSVISDLGPSPSIVAAAVAKGLYQRPLPSASYEDDDAGSSVLEDWTEEASSVEGLKSKLERWRTEMPPMYDREYHRKVGSDDINSKGRKQIQRRRHTDGGAPGLFSCFANAYGCEFSITCGTKTSTSKKRREKKRVNRTGGRREKVPASPSENTIFRPYV